MHIRDGINDHLRTFLVKVRSRGERRLDEFQSLNETCNRAFLVDQSCRLDRLYYETRMTTGRSILALLYLYFKLDQ